MQCPSRAEDMFWVAFPAPAFSFNRPLNCTTPAEYHKSGLSSYLMFICERMPHVFVFIPALDYALEFSISSFFPFLSFLLSYSSIRFHFLPLFLFFLSYGGDLSVRHSRAFIVLTLQRSSTSLFHPPTLSRNDDCLHFLSFCLEFDTRVPTPIPCPGNPTPQKSRAQWKCIAFSAVRNAVRSFLSSLPCFLSFLSLHHFPIILSCVATPFYCSQFLLLHLAIFVGQNICTPSIMTS